MACKKLLPLYHMHFSRTTDSKLHFTSFSWYHRFNKKTNREADSINSYERIKRMYEHREADRVPIPDDPWQGALCRWRAEGRWIRGVFWFGFDVTH